MPAGVERPVATEGWNLMKSERQNEAGRVRRQASQLLLKPIKQLFGLLLRSIVASVVFYAVMAVALHALGYSVPRISDVGRYFEGLSELTKILS